MRDLNVLALFKAGERFIYVYDDDSRDEVLDAVRDAAADPATSLSWADATVLVQRAREQAHTAPAADEPARH
jgi:hypothetical protein